MFRCLVVNVGVCVLNCICLFCDYRDQALKKTCRVAHGWRMEWVANLFWVVFVYSMIREDEALN